MSDKVCKKENSQKPEKILLLLKKIMKKSESKPLKDKENNKVDPFHKFLNISPILNILHILN
jgi:hypothetical protein